MGGTADVGWETCSIDGCIGVRPKDAKGCLVHDVQHRAAVLQRLGEDGRIDARGVTIDAELLAQILVAAARQDSQPVLLEPPVRQCDIHGRSRVRRGDVPGQSRLQRSNLPGILLIP